MKLAFRTRLAVAALMALFVSTVVVSGQIVISAYNFNASVNGATAGEDVLDLSPSALAPGLSASDLVSSLAFALSETGGPVNPTATTNSAGAAGQNPYLHSGSISEPRNLDGTFAFNSPGRATRTTERFLTFTVNVPALTSVDLTSFSFDIRQSANSGANANGANTFRVLVNGSPIGSTQSNDSTSTVTLSFDLSSVPNLDTDFTVALGLFGGGGTSRSAILDNLSLTGEVSAIPEPSLSAIFALAAAVGFVTWRRRRSA